MLPDNETRYNEVQALKRYSDMEVSIVHRSTDELNQELITYNYLKTAEAEEYNQQPRGPDGGEEEEEHQDARRHDDEQDRGLGLQLHDLRLGSSLLISTRWRSLLLLHTRHAD